MTWNINVPDPEYPYSGLTCPQTAPPVVESAGPPEAAAWVWLIIVGLLIGFELWATWTGHHTLSDWLRKYTRQRRWRWLKWLGVGALTFLIYHLFWF